VAASVWRDRAVFLTGGNGFVGSWTARALVDAGARVVALVRDRVPNGGLRLQGLLDRVSCVHGDLLDAPLLQRAVAEYEVTVCLHLGAQAMVGVAHRCPTGTFGANVMGTANLLEACRLAGVRHVVLASSDKVYGAADRLPYREDTPLLGSAPYEASKVCAELAATSYARTYGLSIAAARCANVYGGGDLNFSRLVPETMRALDLLKLFLTHPQSLAIVVDEFGGTEGIITMSDIVEAAPAATTCTRRMRPGPTSRWERTA